MTKANSSKQAAAKENASAQASVLEFERRDTARFVISAAADFIDLQTQTRLSGRVTDIGTGGCYVDTMTPFPAGTLVKMRVGCESRVFETRGNVIFAHSGMGMGVIFAEMQPEQLKALHAWINEVNGSSVSEPRKSPEVAISVSAQTLAADASGWRDLMCELVKLLKQKQVLTEIEASTFENRLSKFK